MLEYIKKILSKVSFDPELFEKELKKGIKSLIQPQDILRLQRWCYQRFSRNYGSILARSFIPSKRLLGS